MAGVIGLIFNSAMVILWLFTVAGLQLWAKNNVISDSVLQAVILYSVFVYYWTSSVISNSVHLTICGVFANFYFMGISVGQTIEVPDKNPTVKSAKRAMTSSFGTFF